MSSEARRPGGRSRSLVRSALDSVARFPRESHARETEILRQLTDVFAELKRLSAQASALQGVSDELKAKLEHLVSAVDADIETHIQTTQLLGRLLESARARLEILEEAENSPK